MINIKKVLAFLEKKNAFPVFYPGSIDSPDKRGVISANWNVLPDNKLWDVLDEAGFFCPYESEVEACVKCGFAVMEKPKLAYWDPAYILGIDGEIICENCMKKSGSVADTRKTCSKLRRK